MVELHQAFEIRIFVQFDKEDQGLYQAKAIMHEMGKSENDLKALNTNAIEAVGAILKEARYGASAAYLAELKLMVVEVGSTWTAQLQRCSVQTSRAINRAKGPAQKAPEVDDATWLRLAQEETNSYDAKAIIHPAWLFSFAVVWMLREVELANVERSNLKWDEEAKIVSLYITVSKGDQSGEGVARTLPCACRKNCSWDHPCPFFISKTLVDDLPLEEDFLVRQKDGSAAKKSEIVNARRYLFGAKVSGHSGRRSGALQMIRRGWQVPQVAFLGRWKSNIFRNTLKKFWNPCLYQESHFDPIRSTS